MNGRAPSSLVITAANLSELTSDIQHPALLVYVCIGSEQDAYWTDVAKTIFETWAGLSVHLLTDRSLASNWTTDPAVFGILFRDDGTVYKTFSEAEVNDLDTIEEAIGELEGV
jgi:hypothetical protein